MLHYVFHQAIWMARETVQLVSAMGGGLLWMFMTIRCISFAIMDTFFFIPHVLWYLLSPNIIRRVAYRSSRRTKIRNLELLICDDQLRRRQQNKLEKRYGDGVCRSAAPSAPTSPRASSGFREFSSEGGSAPDRDTISLAASIRSRRCGRSTTTREIDRSAAEFLASSVNPADGRVVNGLPASLGEDGHHDLNGTFSLAHSNSSFDDTMVALQRFCLNRAREGSQQPSPAREASCEDSVRLSDSDSDGEDEEDKQNLHNRATLDIYLPVPLDSLFRFLARENKNVVRGRSESNLPRRKFPIVISVNGGAWIVGCYFWNFLIARVLSALGFVVFCPDYRNFPQTTMEGMTLDVSDAIQWVLNNADRYNGDLSNVTLVGQSAGAHLCMMSLLSQAQLHAHDATSSNPVDHPLPSAPSDVAYNVRRYNPRKSIHRFVGLSGIYNVVGLVKHFDGRGLYQPVLHQIAGGEDRLHRYSLNSYFDERVSKLTGEVLPDNFFDFLPANMFFLHGDADKSAPVSESIKIVKALSHAQRNFRLAQSQLHPGQTKLGPVPVVIEFVLIPGATHTDSIIDEPLSCGKSHLAEFLQKYAQLPASERSAALSSCGLSEGKGHNTESPLEESDYSSSSLGSSSPLGVQATVSPFDDAVKSVNVDLLLPSPIRSDYRPLVIRMAGFVCPF